MLPFLENTWLLWWLVAVVIIIRWFHGAVQNSAALNDADMASTRKPPLSASPNGFTAISGKRDVTRTFQRG